MKKLTFVVIMGVIITALIKLFWISMCAIIIIVLIRLCYNSKSQINKTLKWS